MPSSDKRQESTLGSAARFSATHWSMVLAAGRTDSTSAAQALERLCKVYWYPLYAYVRRQGCTAEDAQDLTQEFFARLLAKHYLADVDRSKGRFRSFLLASLKHFLANEWDRARAQKHGGRITFVPIDQQAAETRLDLEPSHSETPEKLFERQWALTLHDQVLARLQEECTADGKADIFHHLKVTLTTDRNTVSYTELASRLSMSEGAVKVAEPTVAIDIVGPQAIPAHHSGRTPESPVTCP